MAYIEDLFIRMSYAMGILLGAQLFLKQLPHRKHFGLRMTAALMTSLVAGWGFSYLTPLSDLSNLVALQLTIAVIVLSMWFAFDSSFVTVLSACVMGVAAQHIGHHVSRLVAELPWMYHQWSNQLEFICVCAVCLVLYFTLGRWLRNNRYDKYTDRRITAVSIAIVLICTGITRLARMAGEYNFFSIASTSLYAITCCVLALFLESYLYYSLRKESEHLLLLRIQEEERRQYELSRENAEQLSIKCHDLKHKLVSLNTYLPQNEIDSMRSLIDTYDSIYHTGSEALDIVLNEKGLHCRDRGIPITCMGSGKSLDFLDEMEIYSLFGNLLENAITAAEQLEEPRKRIISLVVEQKGSLVYIDMMNFFRGEITLEESGLPRTSKEAERGYHGYGLKSVQAIARKYNGDLSVNIKDGIFTAQVYLLRDAVS
ncbi:MAG: ATP-binding protein [Clostridiales bacterium]|nr:ATP-binding protein [Clostridiales bacterium]